MLTLKTILEEIKDVPVNRLEELSQFVHSLTPPSKQVRKNTELRKKILAFGGTFSDMNDKDYKDFLNHIHKTRATLFDRNIDV